MSLFIWLFFLSLSVGIERLKKSPQQLPDPAPGYSLTGDPIQNRKRVVAHILNHKSPINRRIPVPDDDTLRIVQVDMNMFRDIRDYDDNIEKIRTDLEILTPGLVGYVELPRKSDIDPLRTKFDRMVDKMGCKHVFYYAHPKLSAGIMIASRVELTGRWEKRIPGLGQAIVSSFKMGKDKFSLIVASISYQEGVRKSMARSLGQWLNRSIIEEKIYSKYIILGKVDIESMEDFNASIIKPEYCLLDAFDALGWDPPKFTSSSNIPRDWILVSRELAPLLSGAYMHLTLASPHMPLVVDLHVPRAVDYLDKFKRSIAAFWFFLACLILIMLASLIGVTYWVRSKLYDD